MLQILAATSNKHKVEEFRAAFAPVREKIGIITLDDIPAYSMPEENGYRELRVQEEFDGYFAFQTLTETTCTLVVNDWVAGTLVGRKQIMLPLPDAFLYLKLESSGEQTIYDAESFIELLENGEAKDWTRYNTLISFSDGLAAYVIHSDYPEGPTEEIEADWDGE